MKKNTLGEYKKAVKARYDEIKESDISGLLGNPSPANLRELCILKAEGMTNREDKLIFTRFFDFKNEESIIKQIEKCDTDKLKPAGYFLKNKTKDTKQIIVELIAILIDFKPRPYLTFSKIVENVIEKKEENIEDDNVQKELSSIPIVLAINDKTKANTTDNSTIIKSYSIKQKIAFGFGILLLTSFVGYGFKNICFPKKDCIQWSDTHYEQVECEGNKLGFAHSNPIFDFDENLLRFKKLDVCDTTKFFIEGQPTVWYIKQNNKCEFFNAPGLHPISGKTLKPITEYIINKYIRKE